MKTCVLCRQPIKPSTPAVELAGGLLDPADPDFFVVDESVLAVCHVHRDCLREKLIRP